MSNPEVQTPPQPAGLPADTGLHPSLVGAIPYSAEEMRAIHKGGTENVDIKRLFASAYMLALNSSQNTAKLEGQLQTFRIALTVLALRQGGSLMLTEREINKIPASAELVMQLIQGGLAIRASIPKDKIIVVGN
jgi:hypothetical protein